jgi:hypothetical protein
MSFPLPRVALGMLATRSSLHSLFGLDTPILLDVVAVGLLAYAGALAFAARRLGRSSVGSEALAAWVRASFIEELTRPHFAHAARKARQSRSGTASAADHDWRLIQGPACGSSPRFASARAPARKAGAFPAHLIDKYIRTSLNARHISVGHAALSSGIAPRY